VLGDVDSYGDELHERRKQLQRNNGEKNLILEKRSISKEEKNREASPRVATRALLHAHKHLGESLE
jgi:hypothetical protein